MSLELCQTFLNDFNEHKYENVWVIEKISTGLKQTEFLDRNYDSIKWKLTYNVDSMAFCISLISEEPQSLIARLKLNFKTTSHNIDKWYNVHYSPFKINHLICLKDFMTTNFSYLVVTIKIVILGKLEAISRRDDFISDANITACTGAWLSLVDDGTHSDVTLVSKEGKEVHAHKAILAARSPVFSAMFRHDMKEKLTGVVNIAELDHDALEDFVTFIYTGFLPPRAEKETKSQLIIASDKYDIPGLKMFLEELLIKNISKTNVIDLLILSQQCNSDKLYIMGFNYLAENESEELYKTEEWKSMLSKYPHIEKKYKAFSEIFARHTNKVGICVTR